MWSGELAWLLFALVRRFDRLDGLLDDGLAGGRQAFHYLGRAIHQPHRSGDGLDGQLAGPHCILNRRRDPGQQSIRLGAFGVLAVEKLDEVEDLVATLVAGGIEQAEYALLEKVVHREAMGYGLWAMGRWQGFVGISHSWASSATPHWGFAHSP